MIKKLLILSTLILAFAANSQDFDLTNAVVVAQLDRPDERYALEANIVDIFTAEGIKTIPSTNVVKAGQSGEDIANDSIKAALTAKGFDTYVLVSIRGFDKKFKKIKSEQILDTSLATGHLYPLFREDVVSITFEFLFFRNGQYIGTDLIKCGGIDDRDSVLKKFRKKLRKRLRKKWKK